MLRVHRAQPCPVGVHALRGKQRRKEMNLLDLPAELGELLLRRLDAKDLSVTACVCKLLNKQAVRLDGRTNNVVLTELLNSVVPFPGAGQLPFSPEHGDKRVSWVSYVAAPGALSRFVKFGDDEATDW